jgi:hypothetical protein
MQGEKTTKSAPENKIHGQRCAWPKRQRSPRTKRPWLTAKSLSTSNTSFRIPEDAPLFWTDGYKERLYLDDQGSPMAYDRTVLWIGGKEVATRGYKGE